MLEIKLYSLKGEIDMEIVDLIMMIRPYNSWKPEQISDIEFSEQILDNKTCQS